MSGTYKLGPWPLGIDNVSKPNSLKRDQNGRTIAVQDAFNVDIDRDGLPMMRRGHQLVSSLPGMHSLWGNKFVSLAVAAGVLYRVQGQQCSAITTLNSDEPCDYSELNGTVVVGNRSSLIEVNASGWRTVGVPNAPITPVLASPNGGLLAGRYSVAIAYLRGSEEGALSPLQNVTVAAGGGITVTFMPADPEATGIRIYRTHAGGTVLYRAADVPIGMPHYLLGNDTLGKDSPTQYLTRMMPGEFVTYWMGRLIVARDRTLCWSEPMNYGLTSLRHNTMQMEHRIKMIAGMEGGLFVGTSDGVSFFNGTKPKDWNRTITSATAPCKRTLTIMKGDDLDSDYGQAGKQVAVWLSESGFVLGTEQGAIITPQANRLRIPLALSGSLVISGRRATAVTS